MSHVLTVGITTRNRPDALAACLASLRVIAHLDPEVLVFDDASHPPAEANARVIRDAASPGYIVGRNRLVREAAGEFVLLMDDDARLIGAASIDEAIAVLRGDPGVGAVAFAQAEADGCPWPAAMQPSVAQVPSLVPSFIGFAHMIRRDRFLALGGYREAFGSYGEEKEFCLRLLDAGAHTVYLPQALVAHVVDPHSRDRTRYLRFVARNDCLNSLLNDPLTRLAWMLPARYALYFRMRRRWQIQDPWGGVWLLWEIATHLPEVWKARRPVSRGTLREWRALRHGQRAYQGSAARDRAAVALQPDGVGGG
jgi:GT2 family glycosyltransferase